MRPFGLSGWTKSRFNNAVEAKATKAFEEAWGAFKPLLAMAGFEGRWHGLAVYHPGDDDLAALAAAEVEAAMPAWRAEQVRRKAETAAFWERVAIEQKARDAAQAQREAEKAKALAERPVLVRGELTALVEGRLWLLQPADQRLAIELAAAGDRMNIDAADRLVKRAAKNPGARDRADGQAGQGCGPGACG